MPEQDRSFTSPTKLTVWLTGHSFVIYSGLPPMIRAHLKIAAWFFGTRINVANSQVFEDCHVFVGDRAPAARQTTRSHCPDHVSFQRKVEEVFLADFQEDPACTATVVGP